MRGFGLPCVVAVNRRPGDTDDEVELVRSLALEGGALAAEVNDGFARGGEGAADLAQAVADACEEPSEFKLTYEDDDPIDVKIRKVATQVYGAKDVVFYLDAERKIRQYQEDGLDRLPICMAKTHLSLSADAALLNAPEDFTLPVRDIRAYTGAGWLVPLCGDIQQMPGLGKSPAALNVDIDEEGGPSGSSEPAADPCHLTILRARESEERPTALDLLKEAMDRRGEITDDDRRQAAERSGLPEATVYGISTFYDDLAPAARRAPRARSAPARRAGPPTSARHVEAVATRLGLGARRALRGRRGVARPRRSASASATRPAVRDGDVVDAGPGVVERVAAGATRRGRPSRRRERARRAGAARARRLVRACAARSRADARGAARGGEGGERPRPRRRRVPRRDEVGVRRAAASDAEKVIVVNGDEGDPGSYIDKCLMERNPDAAARGHGARRLRRRRARGLRLRPLRVPALACRS